ncbi:MAG: hypothetical protein JO270_13390 [Acidobacteriaceae bacterium]|nr:hypothetical protein [Acidobacteriaceae bacterium]
MTASTAKRVVLYRFGRQPLEGIVHANAFSGPEGIDFLTLAGILQQVPYAEVKALCFVTEPAKADLFEEHTLFERRPKVPGLWTRFTLRDGDRLDGILSHNLLEWPGTGYLITPPRAGTARQRVFLPRASVTATELMGVVGVSGNARAAKAKEERGKRAGQLSMFES